AGAWICESSLRLSASFSGAFSWMKSASPTAAARASTWRSLPRSAPGARPTRVSAVQALATLSRSRGLAPGAGSQATTSSPCARQRAAQPLPITPAPTMATRRIPPLTAVVMMPSSVWSAGLPAELPAGVGWTQRLGAEQLDDLDRLLDELAIGGEHAPVEIEIVLEPDADVAAEQDSLRHHRHLHAADAEARPHRARRQAVLHRLHRRG